MPETPWWHDDYFRGYRSHLKHPQSTSTGSEGRCDICGGYSGNPIHEQPWTRPDEPDETYLSWKRGGADAVRDLPKPQFTDTRFAARLERMNALKAPAVSKPPRGESEKVVQRYPDTEPYDQTEAAFGALRRELQQVAEGDLIDLMLGRRTRTPEMPEEYAFGALNPRNKADRELMERLARSQAAHEAREPGDIPTEEDPMNLNITAEPGQRKNHRAIATNDDGSYGIFAEHNDLATAVAQVTSVVAGTMSAATFVGASTAPVKTPAQQRVVGTTQTSIKRIVRSALSNGRYVKIDYVDRMGEPSRGRQVYPLYESNDRTCFVAREQGKGPRQFKWTGVQQAEEVV